MTLLHKSLTAVIISHYTSQLHTVSKPLQQNTSNTPIYSMMENTTVFDHFKVMATWGQAIQTRWRSGLFDSDVEKGCGLRVSVWIKPNMTRQHFYLSSAELSLCLTQVCGNLCAITRTLVIVCVAKTVNPDGAGLIRTHHGLDDSTVMQSWWILPPWRNGNLHSLPDVVRPGSRGAKKQFVGDFHWTQMKSEHLNTEHTKTSFDFAQKLWSGDSKSPILSSDSWIMLLYNRLHTYTSTGCLML